MAEIIKTLIFQRIIPSYRSSVFEKLSKNNNIIVCYSDEKKGASLGNAQKLNFPTDKLRRIYFTKSSTFVLQFPLKTLIKHKPKVVISEGAISYLTLWVLFLLKPFFRYKLIIWTHGIKNKELEEPFQGVEGKTRLKILNSADTLILYSEKRKQILKQFIKNKNKIFIANNTLDTDELNEIYLENESTGKNQIKSELDLKAELNFIFIGRMIREKKIDLLIQAFLTIDEDINLLIIGDGPEKENLQKLANNSINIKFLGAIYDSKLTGKYLYASDLMISPGYIGLAIVHAFSSACPVLTFDNGVTANHSPEFEYLINGFNGIILQEENFNFDKILKSNLKQLGKNARITVENEANIKKMILGFENAIDYAINL